MRYVATAQYRTEFTEPIVLAPGDVFRIVQELDADYPGWFLCVTDAGSQAWVPARSSGVTATMAPREAR